MATIYTPPTKESDFYYNPNDSINRAIFNSVFTVVTPNIRNWQDFAQQAIRKSSRDQLKYPGICKGKVPTKYQIT